jgi:hypothetical protein
LSLAQGNRPSLAELILTRYTPGIDQGSNGFSDLHGARRILAVLDAHAQSRTVCKLGISLSEVYEAHLTFTIIVPLCFPWVACAGIPVPLPSIDELEAEADDVLASALRRHGAPLNVKKVIDRGPAVRTLLARIDLGEHDLVVLRRSPTSALLRLRARRRTRIVEVSPNPRAARVLPLP